MTQTREDNSTSSSTTDGGGLHQPLASERSREKRESFQTCSLPIKGTLTVCMPHRRELNGTNRILRKYYCAQAKRAAQQLQKRKEQLEQRDVLLALEKLPQVQEVINRVDFDLRSTLSLKYLTEKGGLKKSGPRCSLTTFLTNERRSPLCSLWEPLAERYKCKGNNSISSNKIKLSVGIDSKAEVQHDDVMSLPNEESVIHKFLEILIGLENKTDLTYGDPLEALLDFILTSGRQRTKVESPHPKQNENHRTDVIHLLAGSLMELVNLVITTSAAFLNKTQQNPEAKLLSPRSHYRALTNFWVYTVFGWILDPVRNNRNRENRKEHKSSGLAWESVGDGIMSVCPMAYAYSFLYPYTDDIMDDEKTDKMQKKVFVTNIFKIIENAAKEKLFISPEEFAFYNFQTCKEAQKQIMIQKEQRVYDLLSTLFEYNTSDCFLASLRNINAAQMESMKQNRPAELNLHRCVLKLTKAEKDEIFDITVRKGVASCFPNAYMLCPDGLTAEEAEIVSVMGSMGQIINDIEGVLADIEEKSLTPANISFLKHNKCLDRFMDRCLTYMKTLSKEAPKRFSSLPLDRVLIFLGLLQIRFLATTALLHEQHPLGVVSKTFEQSLEYWLQMDLKHLAFIAHTEQKVFGGLQDGVISKQQQHQLSSPGHFRSFLVHMLQDFPNSGAQGPTIKQK